MEDNQLVQLALKRRILTSDQLAMAERERQQLADRGVERSLWFMVQDLGLINEGQVRDLTQHVSSTRIRALEVDGYVVQGRIGSGGMGDVFRGKNQDGHEVAIKLLSSKFSQHVEYARRFQREARATLRLHHPHITRSINAGEFEGQRYLIMEMVQGVSLKEYIQQKGPIDPQHAMILIEQMAQALSYAWKEGILHRDVKPANIILGHPRPGLDEPFCAKLCDFGLAKTISGDDPGVTRGELTNSGVALGTPHYMSPEQASGEHDLDQRCDIYSLGASIYHALLGQTLYNGKSSAIIMYKQVNDALDLQPLRDRGINPKYIKLVEGMLAKDLKERISTWDAVLKQLEAIMPAKAKPQQPPGVSSRPRPAAKVEVSTAQPAPPRQQFATVAVISLLVTACVLIGAFVVMRKVDATVFANPQNFADVLAKASRSGRPTTLVLYAGDYRGPWRFGVAHSHLHLQGDHGVRLLMESSETEPMLRLEPGLDDFSLRGVELDAAGRCAIEVLPGSQAHLADIAVTGKCSQVLLVSGGTLSISGFKVDTDGIGIVMDGKARLSIEDATVTSKVPIVSSSHAELELRRCRLNRSQGAADPTRALIEINGGSTCLEAIVGDGGASGTGLALEQVTDCTIRDLSLSGLRIGVRSRASTVSVFGDIKVQAYETGLEWIGARDPGWHWQNISLEAPKPVVGLSLSDLESGGPSSKPATALVSQKAAQ
jgi:serine/threonine protein kinase